MHFDDSKIEPLAFRPIIVAGAPRTGTHFLHALICTSEAANPFAPEYHYLYFLLEAYLKSLKVFDAAKSAGFESAEAFANYHFGLMSAAMTQAWSHLGCPANLVMKHCHFTPVIQVMARHFETMKFVVIVRDARDSIASEVRAARKSNSNPTLLPMEMIESLIARYNLFYSTLISSAALLKQRLLTLSYENLARGDGIAQLKEFLTFEDIDPARLWHRATFDIGSYESFKVHSNLWGKPVSDKNVGRYRETLPDEVSSMIFERTRRVMLRCESLYANDEKTEVTSRKYV